MPPWSTWSGRACAGGLGGGAGTGALGTRARAKTAADTARAARVILVRHFQGVLFGILGLPNKKGVPRAVHCSRPTTGVNLFLTFLSRIDVNENLCVRHLRETRGASARCGKGFAHPGPV